LKNDGAHAQVHEKFHKALEYVESKHDMPWNPSYLEVEEDDDDETCNDE